MSGRSLHVSVAAERVGLLALAGALALAGCATSTQDLERARRHYQALEFVESLAVLRGLGEDLEGLSPAEYVRFAYLRGMTDVRLGDSLGEGRPERAAFRACARDWLSLALERASGLPESLGEDQAKRAKLTLASLTDVEAPPGGCLR